MDVQEHFSRRRLLVLAGLACAMLVAVGLRPISDVDLFWQLRLGQRMLEEGGLVSGDPFTFTHYGERFPALCWLAQVAYAVTHRLGDFRLLQILDNLLFVGAFVVAAVSVRPKEARSVALAGAMAFGFILAYPHNSLRPQSFALLALALLLALRASRLTPTKKIILGTILLFLWQNLHPSVVVGGAALAAIVAGELWEWWRGQKPETLGVDIALLVLIGLAQFATPMGFTILEISRRNREVSLRPPQPAREWLSCWDPLVIRDALPPLVMAGAITLIAGMRARARVRASDVALVLVMGGLAAWSFRFGLFLSVALVPVWARWLEAALPDDLFPEPPEASEDAMPPLRVLVQAAMLAGLLAAVLPVLLRPRLFTDDIPGPALRALAQQLPAGRIYNFQPYGGPLSFTSDESWQVLMDGRIYVYSNKEWDDYYDAADGKVSVDTLVEQHAPDAFFLHPFVQKGLIDLLMKHPQWQRIHPQRDGKDDGCWVFLRRKPGGAVAARGAP